MSPVATTPMNAVMAWIDSIGLKLRLGVEPAAISTTMVSPTARETPSTIEATIPERAAGKTTRVATRIRLAPRA